MLGINFFYCFMHVFKFHDSSSIDVNKQTEKCFCLTEDLLYVPGDEKLSRHTRGKQHKV